MKRKVFVVMCMCLTLVLAGCSNQVDSVVNQVEQVVKGEDEHVLQVKGGYLDSEPNKTVGELFDNFFGNPKWSYFMADTGEDVVEFSGDMMYMDTEVRAKLQIIFEGESFEFGALSFNDVPQTELITSAVVSAIIEENSTILSNEDDMEAASQNIETELDYVANTPVDSTSLVNDSELGWVLEDLTYGYVHDLLFGIGDTIEYVVDIHGEPAFTDLYEGSYYLSYDTFTVFNDSIESEYSGVVTAISVNSGTVFDITIGGPLEQATNVFGEPFNSYYEEEFGYVLQYDFEGYTLEVGAEDEFSPINYIYIF